MPIIPIADTASPAQYPLVSERKFYTYSIQFLDGNSQSFPGRSGPSHQWRLSYQRLDQQEVSRWVEFLAGPASNEAGFGLVDPVSGQSYPASRMVGEDVEIGQPGVEGAKLVLVVGNEGV